MNKELIVKVLENALRSDTMKINHKMPITEAMLESIIEVLKEPERKTGRWIDHSDDGYVKCPFCGSATNCYDDIDELHYCFSCGAEMGG